MSKRPLLILVAISLAAICFARFGSAASAQSQSIVKTIYIGPELVDCDGAGPQTQRCYQYKEYYNDSWQVLDGQIEGFTEYEEGYIYQLQVEVTNTPTPPSTKYKLVRILSKLPAAPPSREQYTLPASVTGKNWQLVSWQRSQDAEETAGAGITIMFATDGSVSGSGGCNSYSGIYEVGLNNDVEIEGVVSTKKACSEGKMRLEAEYFEALEKVGSWAQDDPNRLQLKMNNGNTLGYVLASGLGMPRTGGATPIAMLAGLGVLVLLLGLLLTNKARSYQP